jgi:hypothetical protein
VVRFPGRESNEVVVELERNNNGKTKFELVKKMPSSWDERRPTLVLSHCLPIGFNGKRAKFQKAQDQAHTGIGHMEEEEEKEEEEEEEGLRKPIDAPNLPHNIGYSDRTKLQQILHQTESVKATVQSNVNEVLANQPKIEVVLDKAKRCRRKSLIFREMALLLAARTRLQNTSGVGRAVRKGLCCKEPFCCFRRNLVSRPLHATRNKGQVSHTQH